LSICLSYLVFKAESTSSANERWREGGNGAEETGRMGDGETGRKGNNKVESSKVETKK
jgi:hypothetical protein